MTKPFVLIVDDEKNIRTTFGRALDLEGFEVDSAGDGAGGILSASKRRPDLVLLDLNLPDMTGLEVLEKLRIDTPELPVVMMSGHGTLEAAMKATRLGAVDFLEKPVEIERLILTARNSLRLGSLAVEVAGLQKQVVRRHGMVGESEALEAVKEDIRRAAPTKARVLITGESGTGKELVAQAIHDLSRRRDAPFVKLNCAAIAENLVESELFGHEKGAFTGAERTHLGRFERAHEGTLFLDEIGEMPMQTQARLLRVLQEGEVERVGGNRSIPVDVRVIAATNRDLPHEISAGTFREDLYYRLNVIPVSVPPLRERKSDVPALAEHLLRRACRENDLEDRSFSNDALKVLTAYDFPGNVRELAHLVERLAILSPENMISADDVRHRLQGAKSLDGGQIPREGRLYDLLESFERRIVEDRISQFDGNMSRAAEDLGLERSHLYKKVRRLGIAR